MAAGTDATAFPWPPGVATGVGSLPGDDPAEAMRIVIGELPDFPHLVELPAAGVGADMIGRGAAHLAELHVEYAPSGWRFTQRPGGDERRARALLRRDLDVLEEFTQGFRGPLKIQCAGPWTLAATIELRYGDKALADSGAVRDIADALAEGIAEVTRDVSRRVPGARLVVQLDEPLLPAVRAGTVPTASGFAMLPAIDEQVVRERLGVVLTRIADTDAVPVVHCCAAGVPIDTLVAAGARAIGLDVTLLAPADDDSLGAAVEKGVRFFFGIVPSTEADDLPTVAESAAPLRRLWNRLGFPAEELARHVVTPACGLAGASVAWVRRAYRRCVDVGRSILEAPEGW
ncbi:Methionine synthase, vitamin-B12 independent [Acidothermus cellulolyticus 11B]|uniref:Methionine synthase, vitamin-B12 independent n=1 Tax=Acidothermus cellulolyticus (strain ATCC 43068 / DSM 8971 / 11B) TaxID=351607 RepID=A0LSQ6_ACIC1|nr:methionine synthase [Acidothermus cellulolyticus]ABK52466.1 Methionine synthase, vitamin-B12 independent [Acidothermus cellulolyticus 11B]